MKKNSIPKFGFFIQILISCIGLVLIISACNNSSSKDQIVSDIDVGMDTLFYWHNIGNEITSNGMLVMKGGVDTTLNNHKFNVVFFVSTNPYFPTHSNVTNAINLLNLKYHNSDNIELFTLVEPWKEQEYNLKNGKSKYNSALFRIPSTNTAILVADNESSVILCEVHDYFNRKDFNLNLEYLMNHF